MKLSSPRILTLAAIALAASVAIVALAVVTGGGDDEPNTATGATPRPTPRSTSGAGQPEPTATAVTPPFSGPVVDGLRRGELAPGEAPGVKHGVVFIDLESGVGELWTYPGTPPSGSIVYSVDATHRWIQSLFQPWLFVDRTTGEGYQFDNANWYPLAGPTPQGLLLAAPSGGGTGAFAVVDLASDPTGTVSQFSLPFDEPAETHAAFLGDGSRLLIVARDPVNSQTLHVFITETATGTVTESDRLPDGRIELPTMPDGGALAFAAFGGKEEPATVVVRRFDAEGAVVSDWRTDSGPSAYGAQVSPDGRWLVWQEQLDLGIQLGAGGVEDWPVLVLADLEAGKVRFRALRASMTNGTQTLRWLSDSSALVIATQDGFALLGVDQSLTPLPFGPVGHFNPVPVPAPHDTSLFAYAGRIVDTSGNVLMDPAAAGWAGNGVAGQPYGFNASGSELRLVLSLPFGGDFGPGGIAKYGLPVKIETPPFPETTRLRVETGGDALNVRRVAGVAGEVLGQLENGTIVTVAGDHTTHCGIAAGCSEEADPDAEYDTVWWLYVRANDGLEGWVRSDFLAWAE